VNSDIFEFLLQSQLNKYFNCKQSQKHVRWARRQDWTPTRKSCLINGLPSFHHLSFYNAQGVAHHVPLKNFSNQEVSIKVTIPKADYSTN